ncbi:MAG: hypothetical protein ABIM62_04600 [candidate division WOR-3 bacterium]
MKKILIFLSILFCVTGILTLASYFYLKTKTFQFMTGNFIEIFPQKYKAIYFNFPKGARVEGKIHLIKGENINMYLLKKEEFENYKENKEFHPYISFYLTKDKEFLFITPAKDKYYFIFENASSKEIQKLKLNLYIKFSK